MVKGLNEQSGDQIARTPFHSQGKNRRNKRSQSIEMIFAQDQAEMQQDVASSDNERKSIRERGTRQASQNPASKGVSPSSYDIRRDGSVQVLGSRKNHNNHNDNNYSALPKTTPLNYTKHLKSTGGVVGGLSA